MVPMTAPATAAEPGDPVLPEPGDAGFIGPVRLVLWEDGAFSYPYLRVPVPFGLFLRLPPHPAYKWEYYGGRGVLTPRPKFMHAVRAIAGVETPPDLRAPRTVRDRTPVVRPLADAD